MGDQCINSYYFYNNNNETKIKIDGVEIKRIMLSRLMSNGNKDSYKYHIGYINNGIKPLKIKFPKMTAHTKYFGDDNKFINLIANDKELLQKYNKIWDKISNLLAKKSDSETVYYNNCIKTKMKIYKNKVFTNFQDNKILTDNEYCACLSVLLLESVLINSEK